MPLPVVAITNQSSVLTDTQVSLILPALQKQVSNDFRSYWGLDATLTFVPKDGTLAAGWWQLVVLDNPDQAGALGYHELSSVGTPLGKVFAGLDINLGQSWTNTLSHELLEMIADPFIDTCKQAVDGQMYALEVADAVEADNLGYQIDGVLVSDFVTPRWFNGDVAGDRFSFRQSVKTPLELAPGGYISVLDPQHGWIQMQPHSAELESLFISQRTRMEYEALTQRPLPEGSRRHRRTLAKSTWRRSAQ